MTRKEGIFMSKFIYKCPYAKYMYTFLSEYEIKGYKSLHIKKIFEEFDIFFLTYEGNKNHITESLYREWFDTTVELKKCTRYQKASVIIRFLKYLRSLGEECYIPQLPRYCKSDFAPHIYSKDEISRLLKACDNIRIKERITSSSLMVLPALIRLLYSTGIRIGEALAIKNKDVSFERHVIFLNITKNGNQRFAPINSSLEIVLKQYISYRDKMPIENLPNPDSLLFVTCIGKPCKKVTISRWFIIALKAANIPYKGNREGPRIHDLRHTAAVHSYEKMISEGKDAYCCLPIMSQFLGHTTVRQSEYYLRLTTTMYPELLKQDYAITDCINNVITRTILYNPSDENKNI